MGLGYNSFVSGTLVSKGSVKRLLYDTDAKVKKLLAANIMTQPPHRLGFFMEGVSAGNVPLSGASVTGQVESLSNISSSSFRQSF